MSNLDSVSRSCFECNFCYRGDISCPKCGQASGEPLSQGILEPEVDALSLDEDAILWVGLNEAIVGYAYRCGMDPVALYDRERCIEVIMESSVISREAAEEFFEFNVAGAWVGEKTPLIAVMSP